MSLSFWEKHVYGVAPSIRSPLSFNVTVLKDTYKNVEIKLVDDVKLNLSIFYPNLKHSAPVFLFLNKYGNHTLVNHPDIPISSGWTDTGQVMPRGCHSDRFPIQSILDRGYAVASIHESDIEPDRADGPCGVQKHIPVEVDSAEKWGLIAAWSYGLRACIDYFASDVDIQESQIIVTGHSRRGKAALWTGAQDDRVAMIMPHQSGTGGTAPSIKTNNEAETIAQINDQFPHWFCDNFKRFNDVKNSPDFDQDALMAHCAPRPMLVLNAAADVWSDPNGTLAMVNAARDQSQYQNDIEYYVRDGGHGWNFKDWQKMLQFADRYFK